MAAITYINKRFSADHMDIITSANDICAGYAAQGLSLTLRQLYYQFVARGLMANRQSEYKRLGGILNDARMAGELDWDYLVDRTRNLVSLAHWDDPAQLIRAAASQFRTDLWRDQKLRVEVWIEKDAGIGVIESVCNRNLVPFFSCRGYTSVSEIWGAAQRIGMHLRDGERTVIIHIGDHDPSGLDMTRDIDDRLATFIVRDWVAHRGLALPTTTSDVLRDMRDHLGTEHLPWREGLPWRVERIALNYPQVQQYDPPPNPAKTTDARFSRYVEETGLDESWELDALDPIVLQDLIQDTIDELRDEEVWNDANADMERERQVLTAVSANWSDIRDQYDGDNETE